MTPTPTYDFGDIGERLPVADLRGIIAHRHYGSHQDAHDATAHADLYYRRILRNATPLETGLLRHHHILDPAETRPVMVVNTYHGPIREQRFALTKHSESGRLIAEKQLTDDRITTPTTEEITA